MEDALEKKTEEMKELEGLYAKVQLEKSLSDALVRELKSELGVPKSEERAREKERVEKGTSTQVIPGVGDPYAAVRMHGYSPGGDGNRQRVQLSDSPIPREPVLVESFSEREDWKCVHCSMQNTGNVVYCMLCEVKRE